MRSYNLYGKKYRSILDIGCGGGGFSMLLKNKCHELVGLDMSIKSLKKAERLKIYDALIHCSIEYNPFPDNYFDVLISTDVLGHTSMKLKERLYREFYRILKPGGKMLHVIETDSNNFWIRHAKRTPELYQKNHIDKYGHIGMEMPETIIRRIREIGFRKIKTTGINGIIIPPEVCVSWFDEYNISSNLIRTYFKLSKVLMKNNLYRKLFNISLGVMEKAVNPFLNINRFTGLLLRAEK